MLCVGFIAMYDKLIKYKHLPWSMKIKELALVEFCHFIKSI